ncbi:sensor histidine kinase [Paenibacillus sp. P36]|uniref:cache domain-containing sensor histidine kinase n=1 Tax=Paenibacillus sp. P36 TaxID=3342538 RepID=UPI0038B3824B
MRARLWKFGNFSLKRKAFLIFLLFVTLPTFGVGVLVQHQFSRILTQQFVESTKRSLDTVTNQLTEETKMVEDIADYMIFSPDIRNFLHPSGLWMTGEQTELYKENIEGFLTFQLMSKNYIKSIMIQGLNENRIHMGEPVSGNENEWLQRAAQRKGGLVWSEAYPVTSDWYGPTKVISLFRIINSFDEITQPLGKLIIRLDASSIVNLLKSGIFKESGIIFIVGKEGNLILTSDEKVTGERDTDKALLDTLRKHGGDTFTYELDGASYLTFHQSMENTGWQVVAMVPEATMNENTAGLKFIMLLIIVATLILGLAALIGFHYTIILPILRLKRETGRVKQGDFTVRVPIESHDEISELNRQFNGMVMTIQELIEYKYKLELRQRESELKLLQKQMDPHFLYNTLDMIRWTARLEKASRTSQLIEMLSKFFRSSLGREQDRSTIQQELEFVQSYLFLQQKRLGGKLEYSLLAEAHIADAAILKLTIQPLVENFLKHGLDSGQPRNFIKVKCYQVNQDIWIDVQDNGRGLSHEQIAEIRESLTRSGHSDHRGAMANIHERLSIVFGAGYGLEIVEASVEGTWIRLIIPYESQNGGEWHER